MRKLFKALMYPLVLGAAYCYLSTAWAVVIEGTTPQGQFKTVGLDSQGRFQVNISSGVAYRVITDTGSVTNITNTVTVKGSSPNGLVIQGDPGGIPVPVTGALSGTISVTASTAAAITSSQPNIVTTPFTILGVDPNRKQSIVCNNDPALTVWLGNASVATTTGIPLGAGGCMSPDVPASFTGALFGISSATTSGNMGVIEFK